MDRKTSVIIGSLAIAVLLSAGWFLAQHARNIDAAADQSNSQQNGATAMQALSPDSGPPPTPWPVPGQSQTATAVNWPVANKVTESSVVTQPPEDDIRAQAGYNAQTEVTSQTPARAHYDYARPEAQAYYDSAKPVYRDESRIAQYLSAPPPVIYPHRKHVVRETVIVEEEHSSGKVHLGRAMKHIIGFSVKLPFKLHP